MHQVVEVVPRGHLLLDVSFRDGLRGAVRFNPSALTGALGPLRDPEFFGKVFLDHGAVAWPGEVDLAPDAMYDEIKARGEWVLS